MKNLDSELLNALWYDFDARKVLLRREITERLGVTPPPRGD